MEDSGMEGVGVVAVVAVAAGRTADSGLDARRCRGGQEEERAGREGSMGMEEGIWTRHVLEGRAEGFAGGRVVADDGWTEAKRDDEVGTTDGEGSWPDLVTCVGILPVRPPDKVYLRLHDQTMRMGRRASF